jgi:hypothetical protein
MRNTLGFLVAALRAALAGKKTYLVAVLVIAVTGILVFFGKLTPTTASTVALVALGLFAASFRSALAAHQAQVLEVLTDTAVLGKAVLGKNSKLAGVAGIALVTDAGQLVDEIQKETPAK